MTRKTSYLVAGSDVGKTKTEAAQKYGVPVIDEQALARLLAPSDPLTSP